MMNPTRRAALKIAEWRADPVSFVREEFNTEPDEWQKDFLCAFNDNQRLAAKACKGPGKTTVLAWCAWLFLSTRPHPKIAATSISGDNLKDGLWSEMAKWQMRSDYLKAAFEWQKERIISREHPETWWMSARRWSQSAKPEQQADTLAGLHADYILFIIDEAGGVPDAVMAAAEAALSTGIECKLLIAGNPTHLTGPLYRACTTSASRWHVIEITGDPDDPKRSPRISIQWAREQIKEWGIDNPWVLVNVFGRFPPSSINSLLGPEDVEAAMKRVILPQAYQGMPKILGVDVARQGDDSTVIAPRQGIVCFRPKVLRIPDSVIIAGHVAQAINKFSPDGVFVDGTGGYGSGVIDSLRAWGYPVTEVQFGGKAMQQRYFNKRTEMHHELAGYVKAGACLPDIKELKEELCAQQFTHKKDQIHMIEKAQIKAILGRSPDLADGYALTHAFPVAKRSPMEQAQHMAAQTQSPGDYDPIKRHFGENAGAPERSQHSVADYNPLV